MSVSQNLYDAAEALRGPVVTAEEMAKARNAVIRAWGDFQAFERRYNQVLAGYERRYEFDQLADAMVCAAEEGDLSIGRVGELLRV